jgi:nucleotide-binding universal stress UspA family protein
MPASRSARSIEAKEANTYRTLIWSTDGSEGAEAALVHARILSELSGARIVAVHCDQRLFSDAPIPPRVTSSVYELLDDGLDIELIVRHTRREAADVVAELALELDADLIVCGTRGRGALAGAFLGSFTHRLLHVAPCPVLAVQGSAAADERADERELAALA